MPAPTLLAGELPNAAKWADILTYVVPVSAAKPSGTARTSTTTVTADPHLTIALPANTTWDIQLMLLLTSAANAAGDFAGEMHYPVDATLSMLPLGLNNALATGTSADLEMFGADSLDPGLTGASMIMGCSTTMAGVLVAGRITIVTAGSLVLFWAQNTSNASSTTVNGGSTIVARRAA
jgi:hypothetical protein